MIDAIVEVWTATGERITVKGRAEVIRTSEGEVILRMDDGDLNARVILKDWM